MATALDTPSMAALFGPFTAVKPYTTAAIFAASMMVFTGLLMAIMNIFFAVRNTRTQEDNGVLNGFRAHSVGRQSPLLATIYELLIINVAAGLLSLSDSASNQHGWCRYCGNWLFGIGIASLGMMFGSFALFCAQLASNSRGATTMSYGCLVCYIF